MVIRKLAFFIIKEFMLYLHNIEQNDNSTNSPHFLNTHAKLLNYLPFSFERVKCEGDLAELPSRETLGKVNN